MSDELGFANPKVILKDRYKLYVAGGVLGAVVIPLMNLPPAPMLIVSVVALFAAPMFVDAIVIRRKFVFLSSEGLRGIDSSGRKTSVRWSDPVKIDRAPYFKWPGLKMEKEDGSHIVLPLAMTSSPEFQEALKKYAPSGHALPEASKQWSAE